MSVLQTQISVAAEPEKCVVRLNGVLGASQAEELRQLALELRQKQQTIELEWAEAEQVHAAVLQVLLALRAELSAAGLALRVGSPSANVSQYLQLAGLNEVLASETGK